MRLPRIAPSVAVVALGLLVAAPMLTGCPSEEAPRCTTPPPASCAPLHAPTFREIFTRTLAPSCGLGGGACHSDRGRQGGLAFVDETESYDLLFARGVVRPGDPSCSEIMVRVLAEDPHERMPPGRALDPGAQCAIAQWIANGAHR